MIDLAVVGAGIVGAFAAHAAARSNPDAAIVVLDRSLALGGATRFSAGLDFPYGATPLRRALTRESRSAYDALRAELPSLPVRTLPLACVVSRERLAAERERFVGVAPRAAAHDEIAELLRRFPELRLRDDDVVLTGLRCAVADVAGVGAALLADARAHGVQVWEGVEVVDLRAGDDDAVVLTLADGRTVHARRVILAPGPWALGGVAGTAAQAAGVRTKRVVALHLERVPAPDDPVVFFLDDDAFLAPLHAQSRTLFSFTRRLWDVDPNRISPALDAADFAEGLAALALRAPELAPRCDGGRAFCDAYGPGFEPVVAADPRTARAAFAGAASGSGYRLAPALALRALRLCGAIAEPARPQERVSC